MEEWSNIKGYGDKYLISTEGRVYSTLKKGKFLKPFNWNGYYAVIISDVNGIIKKKRIHRLVAETFIPNPDNLPHINHKDENKLNNKVDNLEWCTPTYNSHYSRHIDLSVYCFDLDRHFESASEAARETGVNRTSILKCCKNQLLSAGGMWWCYTRDKNTKKWY